MARVIISTGHTTDEPGTVVLGLREVDIARKIAKILIPHLRAAGIITLSVPYDLPLDKRIAWINSTGYKAEHNDLLIEIHSNEGGKSGIEAWYKNETKSAQLAQSLTNQIQTDTGLTIQGVNDEGTHPIGGINLLKESESIAVLLECLYLDNDKDREFLQDDSKIESLAKAIAKGVAKFLNLEFKNTDTKPDPVPAVAKIVEPEKQEAKQVQSVEETTEPVEIKQIEKVVPQPIKPFTSAISKPIVKQTSFQPAGNTMSDADSEDDLLSDFDLPSGFSGPTNSFAPKFPSSNPFTPAGLSQNKPVMSRDERKEMIQKYYLKTLGREATQNDLNYFLNIGITEDQLVKRIIESQEHVDLVQNAKSYEELKAKHQDLETKSQNLERSMSDQKQIMEQLNSLLLQKNHALTEMQKRIQLLVNRIEDIQNNRKQQKAVVDYRRSRKDKVLEYLSKKLS